MHVRGGGFGGGGRGLKTGRFFCLRADGPIMLRGELNNRKFMVIKFSFKIFKILSRFGTRRWPVRTDT